MQLTPRYGPDPVIVLQGRSSEVAAPAVAQRRRLVGIVESFGDDEWNHPSRCEGWTNRDVVSHLDSTNGFWGFSIRAGLEGEPTRFLETFDPVATPAELVAAQRDVPNAELLESFRLSSERLTTLIDDLEESDWSELAEAPPGHLTISAVVHHALWDSWVHERDILLPLGEEPVVDPSEVATALWYAAALSPAFATTRASAQSGSLGMTVTDPDRSLIASIDNRVTVRGVESVDPGEVDLHLTGDGTELLEMLSMRRPIAQPVPESAAWILDGLAEVFDQ